jgi:uncharacterized membrane protein
MPFIHISGEFEDRKTIMRLSQDNKYFTFPPRFTLTSNHQLRKLRMGTRAKRASTFVSPLVIRTYERHRSTVTGKRIVYHIVFRLTAFASLLTALTC